MRNPPPTTEKLEPIADFAIESRYKAQKYLAEYIALKIATLAKEHLSSRTWKGELPERHLWNGKLVS